MNFKLGKKYRDTVYGIEGTATARTSFLTGCDRVCLGHLDKDGEIKENWFDITQLEGVKLSKKDKKAGGPGPIPSAKSTPQR